MGRPSLLARDIPVLVVQSEPGAQGTGGVDCQFPISNFQLEDAFGPAIDNRQSAIGNFLERVIDHPMRIGGTAYNVTCVSMGNPHAVIFTENLHRIDLAQVGPLFEHAPEFPERINAHFVRVDSSDHVTVRTWERGSGATRACGTGACAACVAGAVTGRTQRDITVELPGGSLRIEWTADDRVLMTGEAVEVFSGEWLESIA
ncbi:MAG: diaminopimelate epimerase [Planctomycetes bacterium]|nr:diaminopimelate epimerase [Planctomycetota bacterium]MBI3835120.1 diaminopimelate epimerase [Planctomycetota bacterium]